MTQPAPNTPAAAPLLTVEEVARAIRRHPEVVRRQARSGRLPGEKVGRGWFFRPERLVAAGYPQFAGAVSAAAAAANDAERSRVFLQALSEAGLEAVQLLDQDAIFAAVGRRLAQAGVGSFFFLMAEDGQGLRIVHREPPPGTAPTGPLPPIDHVYPFSRLPLLKLVCETRRPHFLGDREILIRRTADNIGAEGLERARQLSRELGMQAAISAPLVAGDRVIGAITVVGAGLREADTTAMAAFANQTAAAMESARLLRESRESEEAIVEMLAMAIGLREGTSPHAPGHADLGVRLARHLGLDDATCRRVRHAILLQDLGKLGLPDATLGKSRRLDPEERAVLMTHPVVGAQFLARFKPLARLAPIVRAHHERYNGEGYPDGLRGDAIPVETRLIGVVNLFRNLLEEAPRTAEIRLTLDRVRQSSGSDLDPAMVDALAAMCEQAETEGQDWLERLRPKEGEPRPALARPGGPKDVHTVADSRELRIIYRIAQETSAVLDLDVLLKRIVAIVREVMGYYLVSLLLPTGQGPGELRVGAHSGYVADIAGMTIPAGEGITGWAFGHGQPLLVPDVSRDSRYIGLDPNVRSELAFPLTSRGRIVGVLNAESALLNAFSDADLALMAAVGSQLASTLEVAQMHDHLKQEAMHDSLTRLYNRRLLLERLHQAIAHAERHQEPLSIVFVDVNQLKYVNDTYGHLAGDALLRQVAIALTDSVRTEDVVARFGGDEFVVLLASTAAPLAGLVAQRIRDGIARHRFMAAGQLITVPGVSLGIASYPENGHTAEELLAAADSNLYATKRARSA